MLYNNNILYLLLTNQTSFISILEKKKEIFIFNQ